MPKRIVAAGSFALALALIVGVPQARDGLRAAVHAAGFHRPAEPAHPGGRLPALTLVDLNENGVDPSKRYAHGVVVYNVFTSWCPSCNEEMHSIHQAAERLAPRGVRFVGIDQGESPASVSAFASRYDITYPLFIDAGRATATSLGARVIPETIIVRDGIVRSIIVGPTSVANLTRALKDV